MFQNTSLAPEVKQKSPGAWPGLLNAMFPNLIAGREQHQDKAEHVDEHDEEIESAPICHHRHAALITCE